MSLKNIFDVFSRRKEHQGLPSIDIPSSTRGRVLMWCGDVYSNRRSYGYGNDYTYQFWEEIHGMLQMRHGKPWLSRNNSNATTTPEDAMEFLLRCDGAEFLDFLEYIFRVECYFHVGMGDETVVAELNEILQVDNLPYYVTEFVRRESRTGNTTSVETLAFPTVICRENEITHINAIEPGLKILQSPVFANANREFLLALEDFRKGDFEDSLTKCGSSFESVMKVICDQKGWPYNQNDTASVLVRTIIGQTNLDSYFETTLIIVATLRNRISSAHGAGTGSRHVPRHVASYAINTTASSILLLASEARL